MDTFAMKTADTRTAIRSVLTVLLGLLVGTAPLAGSGALPDPATASPADPVQDPVRVVATLPIYASIARSIGGDQVQVTSIADPEEDAHFVRPKPSFARDLRRADLFITTGLDLELWVPTLLDRAGNTDVMQGGSGYVTAYTGIRLLDIPESADRSQGDIHLYGNPHLHTDPTRTVQVARNITAGLRTVAPDRAERWDRGFQAFRDRIYLEMVGETLVELLGVDALEQLALSGNLWPFLTEREYQGRRLVEDLGGWLAEARALRDRRIICYHKDWAYFEERFGVICEAYVESRPGIPPTPRHVVRLIDLMRENDIGVVLAPSYYPVERVTQVARRGGATAVSVPFYPGVEGIQDYFDLVDRWLEDLLAAAASS